MKGAWILSGVLISAPVWCQEAATVPAPSRASFDLANPEIRKAVRKTAATQTAQNVLAPAKDVEKDVDLEPVTVKFVPPEEPVQDDEYPTSPPSPAPVANTLLSAIVSSLIDDLLDIDDDGYDYREHQDPTIACTARGDDLGSSTCDRTDATKPRTTP